MVQFLPVTVAERSKAKVCRRSLAGIASSKAKPGQSGQRSTAKVQRTKQISPRAQVFEYVCFK